MSRGLPFPILYTVPTGWKQVDPDQCGQPEAGLILVRDNSSGGVTPNVVVSGAVLPQERASAIGLATSYVARLRERYPVTVIKQDFLGSSAKPEVAQVLEIDYPSGDTTTLQRQIHMVTTLGDPGTPTALQILMTCPAELFPIVSPEFSEFVGSIRPAP